MSQFQLPVKYGSFCDRGFFYRHNCDTALALIASLNVPWHPTKTGDRFINRFVFIGFLWDLVNRRVSLPEVKRLKFLTRVSLFLQKSTESARVSLLDVQKIHGSLVHLCFVFPDGNSHLPCITYFITSFMGHDYARRYIPNSVVSSLEWWYERLSNPLAFRQLRPVSPLQDIGIYVDAATSWGIGIIIHGRWYAFRLSPSWKVPGRDICWLEAIALELLIYFLIQLGYTNAHLLIYSDSNGAIGAHSKGRSSNSEINLCVRRTYAASTASLLTPSFRYIESALNPADPISRGIIDLPSDQQMTRLFDLPLELSGLLSDYHV
jgi:hypothetical protein